MKRFLLGTVTLGTALAFAGCSGKSSGDDDDGGAGGESGASGGSAGKAQAGASAKAGTGGAVGNTGGAGGGGSAGKAVGGSGGSSGQGAAAGSGGVAGSGSSGGSSGKAGASMGGTAQGGDGGTPDMPGGSGGDGGEPSHDVGPPQQGSCTAPCQLELAPTGDLPGDSAVLVYDFESGTATLTSDAATSMTSEWVIGFSFEDDPQHGYGSWGRNQWWFAFTKPLVYVEGTYSQAQDVETTSEMINPKTNQILLVTYSFGEHTVRVLDAHEPKCTDGTGGVCTSAHDCPAVDGGILRADTEACAGGCSNSSCTTTCLAQDGGISTDCAGCYVDFLACVTEGCPTDCPSQGGNACMSCEVEHCSDAFMSCSGLDYMPRGTLTWPLYVPPT